MTKEEMKTIVSEVMASVMPTMAESIANAMAKYTTETKVVKAAVVPTPKVEPKTVPSKKVSVFEYSEASWAIVGDDKEYRHIVKKVSDKANYSKKLLAFHDEPGWTVRKKDASMETIVDALAKGGYEVLIGESVASIKAEIDAKRKAETKTDATPKADATPKTDATPKADVEPKAKPSPKATPKVIAMEKKADMNVKSFIGTLYGASKGGKTVITDSVRFTQIPTLHQAYFYTTKDGEFLAIYAGGSTWMSLGKAKILNGKTIAEGGTLENHDVISSIAQGGVASAMSKGVIKNCASYMAEAYEAGGMTDAAKWLRDHMKKTA